MKILLLAPHPFFQNRGTPIAVDLLVRTLCGAGHNVHLLTFNEGEDRYYENLKITRVGATLGFKNINPGFSLKKIMLDVLMFFRMVGLHRSDRYDVVHAVEESAFLAYFLGLFTKVPFIYDMDSSMVTQLSEKMPVLKPFIGLLRRLEALLIKRSLLVIPVCDALVEICREHREENIWLLKDISMMDETPLEEHEDIIRKEHVYFETLYTMPKQFVLYAGNLETYQGIELMIKSFALAVQALPDLALIVVGGKKSDIQNYSRLSNELGIAEDVVFLGPKPVQLLKSFCEQASLLLSPRISGENTPMKIFSYLDSGTPVLATNLPTHTEVVDTTLGYLAAPDPDSFSRGIVDVFSNYDVARSRADNSRNFIQNNHSYAKFSDRVLSIYNQVAHEIDQRQR